MSFVRDLLFGSPPEAPDYSPIAAANKEVAQMQLDYARERDAASASDRQRLLDLAERTTNRQLGIADAEAKRADDYYNYAKTTFRPLEQQLVNDAKSFNTESERERLAGLAGADIAQAYKNVDAQRMRGLSRYGVGRPNANALAAINNELTAGESAAIAGAKTGARYAARDAGYNRMTNAVNLGRNYPTVSQASSGLGIQGASAAAGGAASLQGAMNQSALIPSTYLNGATSANLGTASIMNTGFQNQYNNWATQGQQMAAIMDFAGAMYGGKADGGEIGYADGKSPEYGLRYTPGDEPVKGAGLLHGPGSGISDDIPALVSKGEYIVPEDVVKAKGVEFFDKLVSKYHMPAEEQRRRYGIGGKHG